MITAILLSGGTGVRAGFDIPKQYMEAGGRPVISYCIETLNLCSAIENYIIVADEKWQDEITDVLKRWDVCDKFRGFADPGTTRQLSILNGLIAAKKFCTDDDYVMVHDAARPLLRYHDIEDYIVDLLGHDGLLPVLPMKDTVYMSEDGKHVSDLIDRSKIYAGQAPEFFVFAKYLEANLKLGDEIKNINGSTEPAVMAGMDIVLVPGSERNFKITTKLDFERFEKIVAEGKLEHK